MLEKIFQSVYNSSEALSASAFLIVIGSALALGALRCLTGEQKPLVFEGSPIAFTNFDEVEDYIRRSRRRVDDLRSGILACTSGIENFSSMSRTHEEQDRIRMRIEEIEGVNCIVPCATDLEVISADADKGTALLALAACLGIGRSEVMAMGDGDNDYSMMQTAGLSVAVANADAKILSASDHVTASNDENGVAKAICRFVL